MLVIFFALTVWSPSLYWGHNSSFQQVVKASLLMLYCPGLLLPFPHWTKSSATRGRFVSLIEIDFYKSGPESNDNEEILHISQISRNYCWSHMGEKSLFRLPELLSQRQIWCVALGEYQKNSASNCPMWFIIFKSLVKASRAVKLCPMLPNYCKTFDLSKYKRENKLFLFLSERFFFSF